MATFKGFRDRLGLRSQLKTGVSRIFETEMEEEMAKQANNKMPSKGVRMPEEMWAKCDEMTQKLGLESRNEYIRDAGWIYWL